MKWSETVHGLIRMSMQEKGLNKRQLAKRLGVSEVRVGQMLGPRGNLTLKTVDAILEAIAR